MNELKSCSLELTDDEEMRTVRLTQSWNGFTNVDLRTNDPFYSSSTHAATQEQQTEQIKNKTVSKPRFANYQTVESRRSKLKMPKSFPGVDTKAYLAKQNEEKLAKLVETHSQIETKLTLDEMESVLTSHKEPNKRRNEKLPKIKITKAQPQISDKSVIPSSQSGSHVYNCVRMLTELNEVCTLKSTGEAGHGKNEENLLRLKTVHEARRYSAFTPRGKTDRSKHTRCRSLPNISTRELPRRFFVKLDPLRASAIQVNLSSWNDTSRRCRILSENLDKLDREGIEPSEEERKVMIGQWIRETSQLDFEDGHVATTEVEA